MGSASSKFKKYLQHGDEFAAMQVFQSSPELRKNLDPNLSYGENHMHNTALHYASKHGMKHLLRTFLNDLGGNPNKRNALNETVLHAACRLQTRSYSAHERRAACVGLLLGWRGAALPSGGRERVDLAAQDQDGNTALHWAASTGLKRCVELLVSQPGATLFAENNDKMTPCDLAMRSNHHDIARLLEARMVFADNSDTVNEDELNCSQGEQEEVYSGLRTQDLQEAKDQLLVETSDMLHIPLFTAEALLRDNEWSRESLLEKWMKDPVQCCQLAGVQAPASALQHFGSVEITSPSNSSIDNGDVENKPEVLCEICYTNVPAWEQPPAMSCKHSFCNTCWEKYLNVKIQEGDAHHILCPAYQCHILVPVELIERVVSPDMARRYLQFDIKAFVESNRSIKWCPMAGCGRAVRLPETEQYQPTVPEHILNNANSNFKPPPATSHAVDCGNSHFFCWECLGEAHAPCGCAQWQQWQHKISEIKPEELRASCDESEAAANCLWLVTNSKPCPNCKSPIQKNEGCNHMKCSKCKFDFCWVCQESWKRHSSATGGYFRCNRFEAATKADEKQGSLINEAVARNSRLEELSRFLHYYTRFRNHENSRRMEEPLLTGVRRKMDVLLASALGLGSTPENAEKCTKFVEEGVRELLKARRVLCGSYVYGYYLEDNGYNKTIFEFMQNELEEVTEKLSEMIARPYLRTPKPVIVQTTALARRKRHEFVRAVSKGLIPPETPPSLRKVKKRKLNDAEMHQAIAESLKQLDPNNPWVKEAQERHCNLTAMYDWPEYESDDDSEVTKALAVSVLGECKRTTCNRPRARNPRTGTVHQYCSLRCSKADYQESEAFRVPISSDYNMDLVIALEMSRLQMIEDRMKQVTDIGQGLSSVLESLEAPNGKSDPGTSISTANHGSTGSEQLDDQLKLAIQLSLQESTAALNKQLQQQALSQQQQECQLSNLQHADVVSTSTQAPEHSLSTTEDSETKSKTIKLTKATITGSSIDDTSCEHSCSHHNECSKNNYEHDHMYENCKPIYNDSTECLHGYDSSSASYEKSNADITVDYFLKSLANHKIEIDLRNIEMHSPNMNEFDPSGSEYSKSSDKELPCFFKSTSAGGQKEDGRFQIGDIHETGYIQFVTADDINDDIFDETDIRLKRSHSTGDLMIRRSGRGSRIRLGLAGTIVNNDEPRYHLDSDHSSNHDEKCEEIARKILAFPSAAIRAKQFLLLQHQNGCMVGGGSGLSNYSNVNETPTSDDMCGGSYYLQNQNSSSIEDQSTSVIFYQGQSSVEDTTTSDSLNADIEICGGLGSTDEELDSNVNNDFQQRLNTTSNIIVKEEHVVCTDIAPNTTYINESNFLASSNNRPALKTGNEENNLGVLKIRTYKKSPKLLRNIRTKRTEISDEHLKLNRQTDSIEFPYSKEHSCLDHHKSNQQPYKSEIEQSITKTTESSSSKQYIVKTDQSPDSSSKMNPLACLKAKLCSAHLPKTGYLTKMAVNKSIGLLSHGSQDQSGSNASNSKQKHNSGSPTTNASHSNTKSFSKSIEKMSTKTDTELTATKLLESHRKAFKLSGGKTISQNLRIRICKSPPSSTSSSKTKTTTLSTPVELTPKPINESNNTVKHTQFRTQIPGQLETDSSNEYESETGIPKSPTLYISGVSISRTPEPKSPGINLVTNIIDSGRQSRSSSLTVPATAVNNSSLTTTSADLSVSNMSLNVPGSPEPYTPSLTRSMTPQNSYTNLKELQQHRNNCHSNHASKTPSPSRSPILGGIGKENCPHRLTRSNGSTPCRMRSNSGIHNGNIITPCRMRSNSGVTAKDITTTSSACTQQGTKSKSASEPEREREMFRFPKSSTDGALSSVLHVQESNLSSDDFHEALFLLERSPKTRDSKRRKKSKKKDKDICDNNGGRKEEASSAL